MPNKSVSCFSCLDNDHFQLSTVSPLGARYATGRPQFMPHQTSIAARVFAVNIAEKKIALFCHPADLRPAIAPIGWLVCAVKPACFENSRTGTPAGEGQCRSPSRWSSPVFLLSACGERRRRCDKRLGINFLTRRHRPANRALTPH